MSYPGLVYAVALIAVAMAGATLNFAVLWPWFGFWRRHRLLTWTLMLAVIGGVALAAHLLRDRVMAARFEVPAGLAVAGWIAIVVASGFGWVADRQLGLRVRSFAPLFDEDGRVELITTGAYAVVRHPIYAAGMGFQLGALAVSGCAAVGAAWLVFAGGAVWFTRQEERRLVAALDDPDGYRRYRARVPALLPWPRPKPEPEPER